MPAAHWGFLRHWMYLDLCSALTADITYFLSLIGVTQVFTVSAVLFSVQLISALLAFPLVEVLPVLF